MSKHKTDKHPMDEMAKPKMAADPSQNDKAEREAGNAATQQNVRGAYAQQAGNQGNQRSMTLDEIEAKQKRDAEMRENVRLNNSKDVAQPLDSIGVARPGAISNRDRDADEKPEGEPSSNLGTPSAPLIPIANQGGAAQHTHVHDPNVRPEPGHTVENERAMGLLSQALDGDYYELSYLKQPEEHAAWQQVKEIWPTREAAEEKATALREGRHASISIKTKHWE